MAVAGCRPVSEGSRAGSGVSRVLSRLLSVLVMHLLCTVPAGSPRFLGHCLLTRSSEWTSEVLLGWVVSCLEVGFRGQHVWRTLLIVKISFESQFTNCQ